MALGTQTCDLTDAAVVAGPMLGKVVVRDSAVSSVLCPAETHGRHGRSQFPWLGSQGGTDKWPRESGRLSDRQIGITWS